MPAYNTPHHDTRSFDMALLKLSSKLVVLVSCRTHLIEKRGVRHGVVCAHVRRKRKIFCKLLCGAIIIGESLFSDETTPHIL